MARLDSSLKIILPLFFKSLRRDFVHDTILNFSNLVLVSFIFLRLVRWHLEILPSTRRWISNCGFFVNNWHSTQQRSPRASLIIRRVALNLLLSNLDRTKFTWTSGNITRNSLLLLRMPTNCFWVLPLTRIVGLRVFRIVFDLHSERLLSKCNPSTGSCTIIAHHFVCQKCNPWSCARDSFSKKWHPIAVIVHILGNCEVITVFFFIWISPVRVERCEEVGLSSLLVLFPPAMSPISRMDWMLKEQHLWETQTLSNRKELKCAPSIQAQLLFQSVLELLDSKPKDFFGIVAILEHRLAASFMDESKPPLLLRNLVLLVSRTPSAVSSLSCPNEPLHQCRSSWLKWWHQSCNHFGDRCWKSSSPVRWSGRNNFPLSVVGVVLFVYWCAGLEEMLIGSAFSFLVLRWLATEAATSSPELVFDCAQAGFAFFCVCVFRDWFRAGAIVFDIWDVQFVHESTLSPGYQNIRCSSWIVWRWNCDLKPKTVKNFHDVKLQRMVL